MQSDVMSAAKQATLRAYGLGKLAIESRPWSMMQQGVTNLTHLAQGGTAPVAATAKRIGMRTPLSAAELAAHKARQAAPLLKRAQEKRALTPAALAATGAGLGAGIEGVRRFRNDDPTASFWHHLGAGAKGALTGGTIGGVAGYGAGRLLGKTNPAMVESYKKYVPFPGANTPGEEAANLGTQIFKDPAARGLGGLALGAHATSGAMDYLDEWKLRQQAALKAKHEQPENEAAPALGAQLAKRRMGDYRTGGG